jgi:type II secretion system protein I
MTSRGGFTLFEAVVALAIISMVAVASLASVGTQLRGTDHARRTTEAIALAQERMTAVQLLAYNDLQSLPDSIASGRFAPPLDMYSWRMNSQPVSDADGLYTVAVQIEWSGGAYTLATRMYKPPPGNLAPRQANPFGSGGGGNQFQVLGGGGNGFQFQVNPTDAGDDDNEDDK